MLTGLAGKIQVKKSSKMFFHIYHFDRAEGDIRTLNNHSLCTAKLRLISEALEWWLTALDPEDLRDVKTSTTLVKQAK